MKIVDRGHIYELAPLDGDVPQRLVFVKRFRGVENHAGTTNQEVIRALIDRVITLDAEKPWPGNTQILQHLRMALTLHECRALELKVSKGELMPESVATSERDGHFALALLP
jgi:hypothetical protein